MTIYERDQSYLSSELQIAKSVWSNLADNHRPNFVWAFVLALTTLAKTRL